jgi:hypothetical protein
MCAPDLCSPDVSGVTWTETRAFGVRKYSALKLPDMFGVALDADWTVVLERLQNRAVER